MEEARCAAYLDNVRKNRKEKITQFLDTRKIVFVGITDDWRET